MGMYSYLQWEKWQVKKEVKKQIIAGLNTDQLVCFEFTFEQVNSELNWHHIKEFEYQGQLYDVVSQKTKNNTIVYWCFADHKETEIDKKITSLTSNILNQNKQRNDNQQRVSIFAKSLFHHNLVDFLFSAGQSKYTYTTTVDSCENSIYPSPPSPPPQVS